MKITVTEFARRIGTNGFKILYKGRYPRSPKFISNEDRLENAPMGKRYIERIFISYDYYLVLVVSDEPIEFSKDNNIYETILREQRGLEHLKKLEKKVSNL